MGDLSESLKKIQLLQKRPDGITSDEWKTVKQGIKELQKRKDLDFDGKRHKAETQAGLAKMFIGYYFNFLGLLLLFALLYNAAMKILAINDSISVKDSFMMVASTITPILAFVLGHYFKGRD